MFGDRDQTDSKDFFFFQAEDGIRDSSVTGVQTCALPISRPDVVICDVVLPDKDGYQVCQFVRAHPAIHTTPVLLISGVVNSTVLTRAAEVQSSEVMFKPFSADDLVRKIDGLLSAHANGKPAAARGPARAPAWAPPAAADEHDGMGATPAGVQAQIGSLAGTPRVPFVALADREGFLIESAAELAPDAEVAGALASCRAGASGGISREVGQGGLLGALLRYGGGPLPPPGVGGSAGAA